MKKFIFIFLIICWGIIILMFYIYPFAENNYYCYEIPKISLLYELINIILFGVLTYLIILAGFSFKKNYFIISLTAFIISFNCIILGEYIQAFIPGRYPAYPDLFAGLFGAIMAIILGYLMHRHPRQKILLHVCCGPCSAYIIKTLSKDFKVTLFFYNPNIFPSSEYELRLRDVKKIARKYFIKLIVGNNNHEKWKEETKEHAKEKEGGERCKLCYRLRLEATAKLAKEKKFPFFTTTMSISPHKNIKIINKLGHILAEKNGVNFLVENFRENNGYKKSIELSKELNLYRQNYCGCEYSIKK